MLQTKQIHLCATYALTLHVSVRFVHPIKGWKLPPQNMSGLSKQKMYKKPAGQGEKINRFLSDFVSLCLSLHFFSRLSHCQSMAKSKPPLQAVLLRASRFFDSFIQ